MAHQRARSTAGASTPHALGLKVLRLSRPSLATQTPLPQTSFGSGLDIPLSASLAYPRGDVEKGAVTVDAEHDGHGPANGFPLTPLLMLPPAFGAAYVGEPFTCTLCINNEIGPDEKRSVRGVRVSAELQTPGVPAGQGTMVELTGVNGAALSVDQEEDEIPAGTTLQRTVRHELKEEGPHQLAVTITYNELSHSSTEQGGAAEAGRVRTFRKLYQFVAQPLIAVRSKITARKASDRAKHRQWTLEAQLENVGETTVVLERVWLTTKEGVHNEDLNQRSGDESTMVLKPQDIEQVMLMLTYDPGAGVEMPDERDELGRLVLALLHVDWRAAMGEKGSLTTGWLACRER